MYDLCHFAPWYIEILQYFCKAHIDSLVQDCSISSALAMEILQSCTKPSILWCDYVSIGCCCIAIGCAGFGESTVAHPPAVFAHGPVTSKWEVDRWKWLTQRQVYILKLRSQLPMSWTVDGWTNIDALLLKADSFWNESVYSTAAGVTISDMKLSSQKECEILCNDYTLDMLQTNLLQIANST